MTMALDPFESMLQLEMPELPGSYQGVQPMIQMPPPEAAPDMGMPQVPGMPAQGVTAFLQQLEQQGAFEPVKSQPAKGMQAQGQTIKEEQGGPDARMRAEGVAARGIEQMENAQVDVDRRLADAQRFEQQAQQLRLEVEKETQLRQQQEKELAEKQERLRGQQMELAQQNDEPIDPNRYYKNMSLFSKAASILSAAVSGYFRPGSAAPIMESLISSAQMDVQAQLADRQSNRAQRSTLIDQYERQYGDTTLVAKRLEADKLLTLSKEAKARGLEAQTAEGRAMAEDITKKLQNHVGVLHREIQEATLGKPIEVTTTFGLPKAKGGADANKALKEALEMDKLLETQGYDREQRAQRLKALGLPPPAGATKAEQEREQANQIPDSERQKLIDRVDGLADARNAMRDIEKVGGVDRVGGQAFLKEDNAVLPDSMLGGAAQGLRNTVEAFGGALPLGIGEGVKKTVRNFESDDVKALRRHVSAVVTGMAKAEGQGALSDTDRTAFEARIPVTDPTGFVRGTQEVRAKQSQAYKNLVAQYGRGAVDEMLRKRGIDPEDFDSVQ